MTDGVKYDSDKPDFTLIPYDSLVEVAKVLTYGANKYPEADNWKRVEDALNRYKKANLRHSLQAVYEDKDSESKLYHLAHAICCDLFALHFLLEKENKILEPIDPPLMEDEHSYQESCLCNKCGVIRYKLKHRI